MLPPAAGTLVSRSLAPAQLSELALDIYQGRRDRDKFFSGNLFSDPAWDMLLAAYCLPTPKRPLSVTALCCAAAAPPSTALRWIERLCELHLLSRSAFGLDGGVINVALTADGKLQIERYLTCHAARLRCETKAITLTEVAGPTDTAELDHEPPQDEDAG